MPFSLSRILRPSIARRYVSSSASSPPASTSLHVTTSPPSPAALDYANSFFSLHRNRQTADIYPKWLWATQQYATVPPSERRVKQIEGHSDSVHADNGPVLVPEVAILGRSNVGKSSLINAILGSPLCRSSTTPGFTKTITAYGVLGRADENTLHRRDQKKKSDSTSNSTAKPKSHIHILHGVDSRLSIVDMPGYGKSSRPEWGKAILQYITERTALRRCFVLIDAKVGFKSNDEQILQILRNANIPHQIILARADKYIPPSKQRRPPKQQQQQQQQQQQKPQLPSHEEYLASISPVMRERLFQVKNALATKGFPLGEDPLIGELISCCSWGAKGPKLMGKGKKRSAQAHVPWGIAEARWAILRAVGYVKEEVVEGAEQKEEKKDQEVEKR